MYEARLPDAAAMPGVADLYREAAKLQDRAVTAAFERWKAGKGPVLARQSAVAEALLVRRVTLGARYEKLTGGTWRLSAVRAVKALAEDYDPLLADLSRLLSELSAIQDYPLHRFLHLPEELGVLSEVERLLEDDRSRQQRLRSIVKFWRVASADVARCGEVEDRAAAEGLAEALGRFLDYADLPTLRDQLLAAIDVAARCRTVRAVSVLAEATAKLAVTKQASTVACESSHPTAVSLEARVATAEACAVAMHSTLLVANSRVAMSEQPLSVLLGVLRDPSAPSGVKAGIRKMITHADYGEADPSVVADYLRSLER